MADTQTPIAFTPSLDAVEALVDAVASADFAAVGDSNDDEIEALRDALEAALAMLADLGAAITRVDPPV